MYMQLRHRADIYTKSVTTNAAGQKKPSWTASQTNVHCQFIPRFALTRVSPTFEEREVVNIFFSEEVSYDDRIYNIKDRKGNVIEAGPFEVVSVLKQPGFSGKVHHYVVQVRRVIE